MLCNRDQIQSVYDQLETCLSNRSATTPLTLTEKLLYAHLHLDANARDRAYLDIRPDRVCMQDATAQMALLQFMQSGKSTVAVPTTIHCDHLIQAQVGAKTDLQQALTDHDEIYQFLSQAADKYGIGFWGPGSGIIHQVVLENYAFPGGLMIGTDSHTVNAGGLGMVAVGVGGADAVDVMTGLSWEIKSPKRIGVHLTGQLSGWTSPKDVILYLAGILTAKGGTGAVIEYFGPGARTLSCTGKGTICNMGAEIGATTSIFPYDDTMAEYLAQTNRLAIADLAARYKAYLQPDPAVMDDPESFYDRVISIDLSTLEPHINGPFSPDRAWPLSQFAKAIAEHHYPHKLDVGLIGSCTNSSYEDISRAHSIAQQAIDKHLVSKSEFTITPGSEMIRATTARDGQLTTFEAIGGVVLANACGPCIGQWKRHHNQEKNSIITSFNRNFSKRNDGNPNTHAFVASPEMVTAFVLAGDLRFNPLTDPLMNADNQPVYLDPPTGTVFSKHGFTASDCGYTLPTMKTESIVVDSTSDRLQLLTPFLAWENTDLKGLTLLIKVKGKCTTDHISMAGPWLRYRGHLDHISDNFLIGATNAFTDKQNAVLNPDMKAYQPVPDMARYYKQKNQGLIVVGDENYGEGSSREHAAMEARYLHVRAVIVRSFARIHETNLKKQGVLALTFSTMSDYDRILETDQCDIMGLHAFAPASPLTLVVHHEDGSHETMALTHTYNRNQINWFKAGSALNLIRAEASS